MSKLATGWTLLLGVLLVNMATAYFEGETVEVRDVARCTAAQNVTQCQEEAQTTFVEDWFDVTFTGLDGANVVFNVFWVLIGLSLQTLGAALILQSWIPLLGS